MFYSFFVTGGILAILNYEIYISVWKKIFNYIEFKFIRNTNAKTDKKTGLDGLSIEPFQRR